MLRLMQAGGSIQSLSAMTEHTLGDATGLMGPAPFVIQPPDDRLLSQRRRGDDSATELMTRGAGVRPGREKDEFPMGIAACLFRNLSQHPAMLCMAAGTGLSLNNERAVPSRHG